MGMMQRKEEFVSSSPLLDGKLGRTETRGGQKWWWGRNYWNNIFERKNQTELIVNVYILEYDLTLVVIRRTCGSLTALVLWHKQRRGLNHRRDQTRVSTVSSDQGKMAILRQRTWVRANRINLRANRIVTTTDWRIDLSPDSRNKIVNKIMYTLQKHMPFIGPDSMNECKKIALRFEEKMYAAAVDQQDYLRKISLKMLSLKNNVSRDGNSLAGGSTSGNQKPLDPARVSGNGISLPRQPQPQEASLPQKQRLVCQLQHQPQQFQQPQLNSIQQELQQRLDMAVGLLQQQHQLSSIEQQKQLLQDQTQRLSDVLKISVESSGQTGQSNGQEKIYQKLQRLKDMYFPDLTELLRRLTIKSSQPVAADQLEKLKLYRTKVLRMMQYCQVPKINIPPGFAEDKIDAVEKQIQSVLSSFMLGNPAPQHEQGHEHFPPQSINHLHSMQPESQSLIPQLQQMNLQDSATLVQPNTVQHSSMPRLQQSGVQTTLPTSRTAMQPWPGLNSTQGSGVRVLQQTYFEQGSNNNINGL
ncbi:hypothetical protein SUGI_1016610 [Cryptomeria japonica]|nr:hypothetical protein SUGI_1016610 [Cryptomeria japonica]